MDLQDMNLGELFQLADKVGSKRYNKLTQEDFDNYRKYDFWRYVGGDSECGSTQESKDWVHDHSDKYCPICGQPYSYHNGRTIDHKLPRARYPWLSLEFKNLWVICKECNYEKGEMHWYEYELYMFKKHPDLYPYVESARPRSLLKSLKQNKSS